MAAPTTGSAQAPSARIALICGLLAIFCFGIFAGIPAIIYGNRTMREINASGGQLGGTISGRFGQIVGWISVVSYICAGLILVVTVFSN